MVSSPSERSERSEWFPPPASAASVGGGGAEGDGGGKARRADKGRWRRRRRRGQGPKGRQGEVAPKATEGGKARRLKPRRVVLGDSGGRVPHSNTDASMRLLLVSSKRLRSAAGLSPRSAHRSRHWHRACAGCRGIKGPVPSTALDERFGLSEHVIGQSTMVGQLLLDHVLTPRNLVDNFSEHMNHLAATTTTTTAPEPCG